MWIERVSQTFLTNLVQKKRGPQSLALFSFFWHKLTEYEAHKAAGEIDKPSEEINNEVENSARKAEEELDRLLNEFAGRGEEGPHNF